MVCEINSREMERVNKRGVSFTRVNGHIIIEKLVSTLSCNFFLGRDILWVSDF